MDLYDRYIANTFDDQLYTNGPIECMDKRVFIFEYCNGIHQFETR